MSGGTRTEHACLESAKQEAWDRFVKEYTSCVDDDPGDARKRYLRLINELNTDVVGRDGVIEGDGS